jgi:hypothetical protein
MGITIDKTIEFFNGLECYTPQAKDAKDVAIDTMRKYQKIMNIVMNGDDTHYKLLMQIKEVIEDGNNDN